MSYKIEVSHRVETKDGKETRNDIVLSKTTSYKQLGMGDIETVFQGGLISFPYKDLESFIKDLQSKLPTD